MPRAGTSGSDNETNKQKARDLNIALCCTVNLSTWERKKGDQNGGNTNGRNSWKLGQTNLLNLCHWCFRLYYFQILDKMLFKTAQHPIFEYLQTKVNTYLTLGLEAIDGTLIATQSLFFPCSWSLSLSPLSHPCWQCSYLRQKKGMC